MNWLKQALFISSFSPILIFNFSSPSFANDLCDKRPYNVAVASGVSEPNRNTEAVITFFCNEQFNKVQEWINTGYITPNDAKILANYLGIDFEVQTRSVEGRLYELVYINLIDKGLCNACAGNAARQYVESPNSYIGHLVERSLRGDQSAVEVLKNTDIQNLSEE